MTDFLWKIEQFHCEDKQLTGVERCQYGKARMQRNPIGCAILALIRLKPVDQETARTIYQVKRELLDDYMREQLHYPTVKIGFVA